MNREFKFRAWDKAYKAMCQTGKGTEYLSRWLDAPEIFVVMECSGLKDRNGRDIYEGDIVKERQANYKEERFYDKLSAVIFSKGGFRLDDEMESSILWPEILEVVGNIYENPNLLDDKR